MSVEKHSLFQEWNEALNELQECHAVFENALRCDTQNLSLARFEWQKAQKRYNDIADKID